MKILKFGGTSVGSPESIQQVIDIVQNTEGDKIVVLSAFAGVTNSLVALIETNDNKEPFHELLEKLETRCFDLINGLINSVSHKEKAKNFVRGSLQEIASLLKKESLTSEGENIIMAQGELISTHVIQFYLQEIGLDASLIPALDFMKTNENEEPDYTVIGSSLKNILHKNKSHLYLTQGFICKNHNGETSNLQRGGSDYTASIIGAALNASEIQIWTDIDGMHNNDPRYVENTFSISEISFDEAAELAYFGAKILHPQSLIPAKNNKIPVLLKNTFRPDQRGTIITKDAAILGVRSIAAKDNITAIKIKSYRMLMAYGFLKQVFDVFETYKTPIDMITTSEVAVSLTIDNDSRLSEIVQGLEPFGLVEVDRELSIICVAGDFSQDREGVSAKVFNALKGIPLRMISYGGSNYNVSLLVKTSNKISALKALNMELFETS